MGGALTFSRTESGEDGGQPAPVAGVDGDGVRCGCCASGWSVMVIGIFFSPDVAQRQRRLWN